MKKYNIFVSFIVILEILLILITNFVYINNSKNNIERKYRVESKRIAEEIESNGAQNLDISKYDSILNVSVFEENEYCKNDYLIESVNGILYRIEYSQDNNDKFNIILFNSSLGSILVLSIITVGFIGKKIINPFNTIKELPYELAKGNLSMPVKEDKNKFLGRFIWGMDMLRENLEENKQKELQYQKEKKTLILSLSHDIKTPLSAIKLYSKALAENLYSNEEKKQDVLKGIMKNADEIEQYVNKIVQNSKEDFLDLTVTNSEFYLSEVIEKIQGYYNDKLGLKHTEFSVQKFSNCLLKGDKERVIEVLQNVMENAIKYGDGNSIKIEFSEEENCKLIKVCNTGCSLKEFELPHIFDSFYRGSNTKNQKGSGLGLYICKQLMHKMDGEIYAEIMDKGDFIVTVVIRKI